MEAEFGRPIVNEPFTMIPEAGGRYRHWKSAAVGRMAMFSPRKERL
jgi:hypothetical protein